MAEEKQEEKICPLFTIAEAMSAPRGEEHPLPKLLPWMRMLPCIETCAFWNANTKRCSILSMDESLRYLRNELDNISASLSYRKGG